MVSWFNQELTGYPGSPKNLKPGTKTETKKPENVPERNQNRISFWKISGFGRKISVLFVP